MKTKSQTNPDFTSVCECVTFRATSFSKGLRKLADYLEAHNLAQSGNSRVVECFYDEHEGNYGVSSQGRCVIGKSLTEVQK